MRDCANDAQAEAASRQGRTFDKAAAVQDLHAEFSALEAGEQLDFSAAPRRVVCVRVLRSVGQGLAGRRRDIFESRTVKRKGFEKRT
jgi:hypothetical protein